MSAAPPSLASVMETLTAGNTNWLAAITARWGAVNDNFSTLLSYAQAVAAQSVQSVNGAAPDTSGAVTLSVGGAVIDVFLASGTWTKRAGLKAVHVLAVSGGTGGDGGPAANNNNTGTAGAYTGASGPYGGGGAVGKVAERDLPGGSLPATVAVAVGVGGAGGAGAAGVNGAGVQGSAGSPGGSSSFGSWVSASASSVFGFALASGVTPGLGGAPATFNSASNVLSVRNGTGAGSSPSGMPGSAVGGGAPSINSTVTSSGSGAAGAAGAAGGSDTTGGLGAGGGPGQNGQTTTFSTGVAGNGGAGGVGGQPGGGGGGGGCSGGQTNTSGPFASGGPGGPGGAGIVIVINFF